MCNKEREMRGHFRTNTFASLKEIKEKNEVLIVVGSEGQPTGMWRGIVSEIQKESELTHGRNSTKEYMYHCWCTALITDKRASTEWYKKEPSHDYFVVTFEEGVPLLLNRIDGNKSEINGIKKNHTMEIKALHGAFRAMTSPESAEILKDITQDKKMSDKEAIEKLDILIKFFKEDFQSWLNAREEKNK
jgi:hypothetical protein